MVINLPESDAEQVWSGPLFDHEREPNDSDADQSLARLQAQDDSLFIATGLAELTAAQADAAVVDSVNETPEGFAERLGINFEKSVENVLRSAEPQTGIVPSEQAQAILRKAAGGLAENFTARNAMHEEGLRKQAQLDRVNGVIEGINRLVSTEPDRLEEAIARVLDIARAASPVIGEEGAGALLAETESRLTKTALEALTGRDPKQTIVALEAGIFDERLDDDTKAQSIANAKDCAAAREKDEVLAAKRMARSDARVQDAATLGFLTTINEAIESGTARQEEIVQARAKGLIGEGQAKSLVQTLEEKETEAEENEARIVRVADVIGTGSHLDPDDEIDRRDAAAFFNDAVKPLIGGLPVEEKLAALAKVPNLLGLMPENAVMPVSGMVLAGEPSERVAAAKTLINIIDKDPGIANLLPQRTLPLAENIVQLASLEMSPDVIVERVEKELAERSLATSDAEFDVAMSSRGQILRNLAREARLRANEVGREIRRKLGKAPRDQTDEQLHRELVLNTRDTAIAIAAEKFDALSRKNTRRKKIELDIEELNVEGNREVAIEAFVRSHREKELLTSDRQTVQLNIGNVSKDWADRIERETGLVLHEYRRSIDTQSIDHVFKRHGEEKEKDPTNEPISADSISIYTMIVENPDTITLREKQKRGVIRLRYEKQVNGVIAVVEEARSGGRNPTLSFFTMWLKKRN